MQFLQRVEEVGATRERVRGESRIATQHPADHSADAAFIVDDVDSGRRFGDGHELRIFRSDAFLRNAAAAAFRLARNRRSPQMTPVDAIGSAIARARHHQKMARSTA